MDKIGTPLAGRQSSLNMSQGAVPGSAALGRGLTRGGAVKRKFAPIIPKIDPVDHSEMDSYTPEPSQSKKRDKRDGDFKGGRGRGGRGRGRGRGNPNLIQTESCLTAIIMNSSKDKSSAASRWTEGARSSSTLKVVGSSSQGENHGEYRGESSEKARKNKDSEVSAFSTYVDPFSELDNTKYPNIVDINTDIPEEIRPHIILPKGQKLTIMQGGEIFEEDDGKKQNKLDHLAENKSLHPNQIYLISLPHRLPGRPKTEAAKPKSSAPPAPTDKLATEVKRQEGPFLSDFSEGYVGKLRIRRSGKIELVFGDIVLNAEVETLDNYMELTMLDSDNKPRELINMGQIYHMFTFRPNMERMMGELKSKNSS